MCRFWTWDGASRFQHWHKMTHVLTLHSWSSRIRGKSELGQELLYKGMEWGGFSLNFMALNTCAILDDLHLLFSEWGLVGYASGAHTHGWLVPEFFRICGCSNWAAAGKEGSCGRKHGFVSIWCSVPGHDELAAGMYTHFPKHGRSGDPHRVFALGFPKAGATTDVYKQTGTQTSSWSMRQKLKDPKGLD